jgi:DNA-binding CsgD family transcriptional regulator
MEVLSLADASKNNDPLRASLGRLIEVVGTSRFETELFDAARSAINCEHISAFVASAALQPRVLISAATDAMPIPRAVAETYFTRYWDMDPVNRALPACRRDKDIAWRIIPEDDIPDDHYRQECYTDYQLTDRISLLRNNGSETYRINFYTGGRYGRFADSDINHMMCSADILMALLVKHDAAGTEASEALLPHHFLRRLRLVAPKMPEREVEVCTAIMLGMTSEAIAMKLGISVNTVLTYRKRAYSRLNISCQNELMRLILC